PDLQRVNGMLALPEVPPPVRGDVVQPPADQAERHRPHGDVHDRAALAATSDVAALAPPDRDDDADDDAQRIGPDRDRAKLPYPTVGAGDVGQERAGERTHG